MVNRVFCYSKEIAKEQRNKLPIPQLVWTTILGIVAFIFLTIVMESSLNFIIFILMFFIWMGILIYYSALLGIRMKSRITGYATDTQGRIFKVVALNNGQGLYFGGVASGGMIDQLIDNNSNIGKGLGGAIGAATQIYAMNRSAEYMSHPEIVAKMIESAPNITGGEVFEILKVYSIINKEKSVKINCDYKVIRTNKIRYRQNITIEKSYNMYEDLIHILNMHR